MQVAEEIETGQLIAFGRAFVSNVSAARLKSMESY